METERFVTDGVTYCRRKITSPFEFGGTVNGAMQIYGRRDGTFAAMTKKEIDENIEKKDKELAAKENKISTCDQFIAHMSTYDKFIAHIKPFLADQIQSILGEKYILSEEDHLGVQEKLHAIFFSFDDEKYPLDDQIQRNSMEMEFVKEKIMKLPHIHSIRAGRHYETDNACSFFIYVK